MKTASASTKSKKDHGIYEKNKGVNPWNELCNTFNRILNPVHGFVISFLDLHNSFRRTAFVKQGNVLQFKWTREQMANPREGSAQFIKKIYFFFVCVCQICMSLQGFRMQQTLSTHRLVSILLCLTKDTVLSEQKHRP